MERSEKIGLDDFLCNHSVDELRQLPVREIRKLTLDEMVESATKDIEPDDLHLIIQRFAYIDKDTERSLYINKLHEKTNISKSAIKNEIKKVQGWDSFRNKDLNCEIEEDNLNIVIIHPSYEVNEKFISIGYRERVIVKDENDIPKLEDQNSYIMSVDDKILVHKKSMVFEYKDNKIVFDTDQKMLLEVGKKWDKEMIKSFVDNPTTPPRCFYEIKQILREHVEFSEECIYGLLSAWIIATYFFQIFDAFPFLLILGKKGCGKSRLLDILERLSFNAIKTKGITVAALSDTADSIRGTFLIDQAESLSNPDNVEMVGILADSYSRGGGKRRVVDISSKGRKVLEFETYSPKAFATYRNIHYDLKDRCIEIVMLRGENEFPYPKANSPLWLEARDKLYRLLLTKWKDVASIYPETGTKVKNRIKELWQPIETILRLESVPDEEFIAIQNYFDESMQETQVELNDDELDLFDALKRLLQGCRKRTLTVTDIAKEVNDEYEFLEDKDKKSLQTKIGNKAKQLNLYSRKVGRVNKQRAYEFENSHVESIFTIYNTPANVNSENESLVPPVTTLKNEVVNCKPLSHIDENHLTTSTTYYEDKKKNKLESKGNTSEKDLDTHKIGGQGGHVVNCLSPQGLTTNHLEIEGGTGRDEVVNGEGVVRMCECGNPAIPYLDSSGKHIIDKCNVHGARLKVTHADIDAWSTEKK